MTRFMSSFDLKLIRNDLEKIFSSPEAQSCTVKYLCKTEGNSEDGPYPGEGDTTSEREVIGVKCIQHIVTQEDVHRGKFSLSMIGKCVFYFSDTINLGEPIVGQKPIQDTMYFIDSFGSEWEIEKHSADSQPFQMVYSLGSQQIGQAVVTNRRRNAR